MKQNSSILFHFMGKSLKNRFQIALFAASLCFFASASASDKPDYLASFDPAKGFKPAQRDLTKVFLQLAGSLENYGSPEPYFRHIAAEDERVEKLYLQATGKRTSIRPTFLSDDNLDQFAKNWNHLAPKLGLENLAKQVGADIRKALIVSQGTRTPLQLLVAQHQQSLYSHLTGNPEVGDSTKTFTDRIANLAEASDSPFRTVRERLDQIFAALDKGLSKNDADRVKAFVTNVFSDTGLAVESEFEAGNVAWALAGEKSPRAYDVAQETRLSLEEKRRFSALLVHDHFTKADFPRLDAFYRSSAYECLSEEGKDQLSMRVWSGIRGSGTH